jgi:hypothetical protein
MFSRRSFLRGISMSGLALLAGVRPAWGRVRRLLRAGPHPTPRPGITAAKVLTREQLQDNPNLIPLFDSVRAIPEVVDGIRCNCGCAEVEGFYSLLSCYEGDAMARHCPICQGQGRMTARLHKDGKTLDEIRAAIDARYG